jgi:hypothetical protein
MKEAKNSHEKSCSFGRTHSLSIDEWTVSFPLMEVGLRNEEVRQEFLSLYNYPGKKCSVDIVNKNWILCPKLFS